ncbi:Protein of unknown function [Bacillus cereus]|nr:Protein of unknown function [Bacillus cereus]
MPERLRQNQDCWF